MFATDPRPSRAPAEPGRSVAPRLIIGSEMMSLFRLLSGFLTSGDNDELTSLSIGSPLPTAQPLPTPRVILRRPSDGTRIPHPANASGPFYSENDGCTACGAPNAQAPQLMDWHYEEYGSMTLQHCIFIRQPETADEVEQAISAMEVSCVENLRYRGSDVVIIARLRDLRLEHLCDVLAEKPKDSVE